MGVMQEFAASRKPQAASRRGKPMVCERRCSRNAGPLAPRPSFPADRVVPTEGFRIGERGKRSRLAPGPHAARLHGLLLSSGTGRRGYPPFPPPSGLAGQLSRMM